MENKIILNLNDKLKVELSSDTPDMQTVIDLIVNNRETIKSECINVTIPQGSKFDKEGFESMIRKVIVEYLKTLNLEKTEYLSAKPKANL